MWMINLIGYLFGGIIALILFSIILALITVIVFALGYATEYVQSKEDGFFHKIVDEMN